jgi:hypothetical protein
MLLRSCSASSPAGNHSCLSATERLGDREFAIGAVRNHRLTRLEAELGAIELYGDHVRLERHQAGDTADFGIGTTVSRAAVGARGTGRWLPVKEDPVAKTVPLLFPPIRCHQLPSQAMSLRALSRRPTSILKCVEIARKPGRARAHPAILSRCASSPP